MAINPNKPVQSSGFDSKSISDMNKVSKTALEAVADLVYDADGDKTGFDDVKKAFNKLSPEEKTAFTIGSGITGTALPLLSLLGEELGKGAANVAKGLDKTADSVKKEVKHKYAHPPEEKLAEKVKNALQDAGDAVEEFADDLTDGSTLRDGKKGVKRFLRDNLTERTPAEKFGDDVKDFFEDAGDAISDFVDDVQDGRITKKIKKAFE